MHPRLFTVEIIRKCHCACAWYGPWPRKCMWCVCDFFSGSLIWSVIWSVTQKMYVICMWFFSGSLFVTQEKKIRDPGEKNAWPRGVVFTVFRMWQVCYRILISKYILSGVPEHAATRHCGSFRHLPATSHKGAWPRIKKSYGTQEMISPGSRQPNWQFSVSTPALCAFAG